MIKAKKLFVLAVLIALVLYGCADNTQAYLSDESFWRICKSYDADFDVNGFLSHIGASETNSGKDGNIRIDYSQDAASVAKSQANADSGFALMCDDIFIIAAVYDKPVADSAELLKSSLNGVSAFYPYCSCVAFKNICFYPLEKSEPLPELQDFFKSVLEYANIEVPKAGKLVVDENHFERIDTTLSIDEIRSSMIDLGYALIRDESNSSTYVSSDGLDVVTLLHTDSSSGDGAETVLRRLTGENEYNYTNLDVVYSIKDASGIFLITNTGVSKSLWRKLSK